MTVIDHHYLCKTKDEVWDAIQKIGNMRGELPYDIDGAVVKLNSIKDREKLGNTIKVPRWAIAYKYPPEEKESRLIDIETGLGRTGRITPVAVFEPITLCGTTVQRATLHNQDFIDDLDLGIGDTVVVYKSGEIIPKIKSVNKAKRPADWVKYHLPDVCPVCGHKLSREENTADYKCTNISCKGQLAFRIINFVSRDCLDIKGFGEEYIRDLVERGYLSNIADVFELKNMRDKLLEDKIFGLEKNTDKILAQIDVAKDAPAEKVLAGLGIPNVGKATAKELLRSFDSIDDIMAASIEDLTAVGDIGEISALAIKSFFEDEDNRKIIEKLREEGLNFVKDKSELGDKLQGLSICITGTLPTMSRDEASALIEKNGGKVVSSVSKKTSMLLEGEAAGSKAVKARELGIRIITESGLLSMLE